MKGIYIHIPFCQSKCPYCDFYSLRSDEETMERYTDAVIREIEKCDDGISADTLYFGGGTPSVIGAERICRMIEAVRKKFRLVSPEITVECNPASTSLEFYKKLSDCGVSRISLGMQSAVDEERRILGRISDRKAIREDVENIKKAGIDNISVDLMIGVPFQNSESLLASIMFITQLDVQHVSAYILKIEEGTFFHKKQNLLPFPDEDDTCDMYLFLCDYMEKLGFKQYEISNFAKNGYKSRHNLKYWHDEEYISFGPSAHSFMNGRRYYYERDIEKYISSPEKIDDGEGGDKKEYAMLALRLTEGLKAGEYKEKFGEDIPKAFEKLSEKYRKYGLMKKVSDSYSMTPQGFLISNTIISNLVDTL